MQGFVFVQSISSTENINVYIKIGKSNRYVNSMDNVGFNIYITIIRKNCKHSICRWLT